MARVRMAPGEAARRRARDACGASGRRVRYSCIWDMSTTRTRPADACCGSGCHRALGTADPQRCCSYTNTDADRDGKAVEHIDDGSRGRADKWRQRQRRRGAIAADVGRLQRPIISLEVRRDAAHARSSGCAPVRISGAQTNLGLRHVGNSLHLSHEGDLPGAQTSSHATCGTSAGPRRRRST